MNDISNTPSMSAEGQASTEPRPKAQRQHKATYARDKRKGGYLIRVQGPYADAFAGKEVPVTRRDNTEDLEVLADLIWSGKDNDTSDNVALYNFVAKPKDEKPVEF